MTREKLKDAFGMIFLAPLVIVAIGTPLGNVPLIGPLLAGAWLIVMMPICVALCCAAGVALTPILIVVAFLDAFGLLRFKS